MSNQWYLDQLQQLAGKRVVRPITDEAGEYFGLRFEGGEILWFLRDDEGNGPGSFELVVKGKSVI